jgi:hypothetical protein
MKLTVRFALLAAALAAVSSAQEWEFGGTAGASSTR